MLFVRQRCPTTGKFVQICVCPTLRQTQICCVVICPTLCKQQQNMDSAFPVPNLTSISRQPHPISPQSHLHNLTQSHLNLTSTSHQSQLNLTSISPQSHLDLPSGTQLVDFRDNGLLHPVLHKVHPAVMHDELRESGHRIGVPHRQILKKHTAL